MNLNIFSIKYRVRYTACFNVTWSELNSFEGRQQIRSAHQIFVFYWTFILLAMDRGFNFLFQGNRNNFGGQNEPNFRERTDHNDRRYDDFYNGDRNNMNRPGQNHGGGVGGMRGGDWIGAPQQGGFFNQAAPVAAPGGMNGPMLSAIQQQNILNALMSTQTAKGLLAPQNQNMGQQNRQQRYNQGGNNRFRRGGGGGVGPRGGGPRGGGTRGGGFGGARPGEKRKNEVAQSGFNKQGRRFQQQASVTKKKTTASAQQPKVEEEAPKVEEIDIPDDEVVVPDVLIESVDKLRERDEVKRNVADEDVEKLLVFCFNGKGYQCKTCGLLLMKESAFSSHLMGKSHVMKVIDARTAKTYQETRDILEIDLTEDWFEKSEIAHSIILKQSKLHMKNEREIKAREAANYNKTPSNFFKFNMELRKSVVKKESEVVITSLVESTVEVKDFTGEKFFGCEFVRAVTGFHCRLCSINIREAKGVIPHIDSKQHKNNYASYVTKNPEYEKTQNEQNQDLFDIMSQHEDKSVVLAESANVEGSQFLSLLDSELVRIPSVMNPELTKNKEKEKVEDVQVTGEEGTEESADPSATATAEVDEPMEEAEGEGDEQEEKSGEEPEEDEEEISNEEINAEEATEDPDDVAEVKDQQEAPEEDDPYAKTTETEKDPPKRGKARKSILKKRIPDQG